MRRAHSGILRLATAVAALALVGGGGAASDPPASFSHDDWTAVLERFVDERGRVDYAGLGQERVVFDRYLLAIETAGPKTHPERFPTRDDELAYYLDAYNAQVFRGVLARGPETESVWSGLISGLEFFSRTKIVVDGETTSLKALEDDVVRARFHDPRVHAALNCASVGCPRLPRKAFTGPALERQLDAAMAEFVNDARNCAVDGAAGTVKLSKIFDWYAADFLAYERRRGHPDGTVLDYVNRYRAPGAAIPPGYRVEYLPYDKRLNRQGP